MTLFLTVATKATFCTIGKVLLTCTPVIAAIDSYLKDRKSKNHAQ